MTDCTLFLGDCIEMLRGIPDNSIDACVTDPPYHLTAMTKRFGAPGAAPAKGPAFQRHNAGFMGKAWDGGDIAFQPETWAEVLRVLKPGGHLLSFGGTRTYHRMACAIEDAGFEVRDMIQWLYGSGFPKSHDISKAIDKTRDDRIDVLAVTAAIAAARDATGLTNASIDAAFRRHGMAGHWTTQGAQPAVPTWHQWLRLREILSIDDDALDSEVWRLNGRKGTPGEAWGFRPVIGERDVPIGHAFAGPTYGRDLSAKTIRDTTAHLGEAKTWQGWGTALKPANEPVVLARKPLAEKTVASNVVEHGTGALNIDGCRVGTGEDVPTFQRTGGDSNGIYGDGLNNSKRTGDVATQGRWPANVIMDEEAGALLDEQTGNRPGNHIQRHDTDSSDKSIFGISASPQRQEQVFGDTGGASRFFYSPKASTAERSAGLDNRNLHPTVKPISLMRYLVRLITPPGGTVLDPFMGSGTTGIAAQLEGMSFMGIEKEQEYMDIARARLNHWATKEKAS